MTTDTSTRRDLVTVLLAALAGLTIGGAAASVAPDPQPHQTTALRDEVYEGAVTLHSVRGDREWNGDLVIGLNADGSADLWLSRYRPGIGVEHPSDASCLPLSAEIGRRLRDLIEGEGR